MFKIYDGFSIENLNIEEMVKQKQVQDLNKKAVKGLHSGIMDSAWGKFGRQLESKAEEAGFPVVRVDPKGTSQRCSSCGTVVKKTLRDRVHDCPVCGLILDRDENSAREILKLGFNPTQPGVQVDDLKFGIKDQMNSMEILSLID